LDTKYIMILPFVSTFLFSSVLCVYPTPEFDITQRLIGRTVYFEYAVPGLSGLWLGNDEAFNGTLYSVRNEHVFDPEEKVRIEASDCGDGYACLKTRWMDSDVNIAGHYMSDRGSDGYDIDFQPEDDPAESDYTKWRVYCIHEDEFQWCYICDYYFSWLYDMDNCLYANPDRSLSTDFAIESSSPDTVYKFKVHIPKAKDEGVVVGGESECNTGTEDAEMSVTFKTGVENILLEPWAFSQTISSEISSAFALDLAGTSWEEEEGLDELSMKSIDIIVPPNNKVGLEQSVASYGSAYRIYGSQPRPTLILC